MSKRQEYPYIEIRFSKETAYKDKQLITINLSDIINELCADSQPALTIDVFNNLIRERLEKIFGTRGWLFENQHKVNLTHLNEALAKYFPDNKAEASKSINKTLKDNLFLPQINKINFRNVVLVSDNQQVIPYDGSTIYVTTKEEYELEITKPEYIIGKDVILSRLQRAIWGMTLKSPEEESRYLFNPKLIEIFLKDNAEILGATLTKTLSQLNPSEIFPIIYNSLYNQYKSSTLNLIDDVDEKHHYYESHLQFSEDFFTLKSDHFSLVKLIYVGFKDDINKLTPLLEETDKEIVVVFRNDKFKDQAERDLFHKYILSNPPKHRTKPIHIILATQDLEKPITSYKLNSSNEEFSEVEGAGYYLSSPKFFEAILSQSTQPPIKTIPKIEAEKAETMQIDSSLQGLRTLKQITNKSELTKLLVTKQNLNLNSEVTEDQTQEISQNQNHNQNQNINVNTNVHVDQDQNINEEINSWFNFPILNLDGWNFHEFSELLNDHALRVVEKNKDQIAALRKNHFYTDDYFSIYEEIVRDKEAAYRIASKIFKVQYQVVADDKKPIITKFPFSYDYIAEGLALSITSDLPSFLSGENAAYYTTATSIRGSKVLSFKDGQYICSHTNINDKNISLVSTLPTPPDTYLKYYRLLNSVELSRIDQQTKEQLNKLLTLFSQNEVQATSEDYMALVKFYFQDKKYEDITNKLLTLLDGNNNHLRMLVHLASVGGSDSTKHLLDLAIELDEKSLLTHFHEIYFKHQENVSSLQDVVRINDILSLMTFPEFINDKVFISSPGLFAFHSFDQRVHIIASANLSFNVSTNLSYKSEDIHSIYPQSKLLSLYEQVKKGKEVHIDEFLQAAKTTLAHLSVKLGILDAKLETTTLAEYFIYLSTIPEKLEEVEKSDNYKQFAYNFIAFANANKIDLTQVGPSLLIKFWQNIDKKILAHVKNGTKKEKLLKLFVDNLVKSHSLKLQGAEYNASQILKSLEEIIEQAIKHNTLEEQIANIANINVSDTGAIYAMKYNNFQVVSEEMELSISNLDKKGKYNLTATELAKQLTTKNALMSIFRYLGTVTGREDLDFYRKSFAHSKNPLNDFIVGLMVLKSTGSSYKQGLDHRIDAVELFKYFTEQEISIDKAEVILKPLMNNNHIKMRDMVIITEFLKHNISEEQVTKINQLYKEHGKSLSNLLTILRAKEDGDQLFTHILNNSNIDINFALFQALTNPESKEEQESLLDAFNKLDAQYKYDLANLIEQIDPYNSYIKTIPVDAMIKALGTLTPLELIQQFYKKDLHQIIAKPTKNNLFNLLASSISVNNPKEFDHTLEKWKQQSSDIPKIFSLDMGNEASSFASFLTINKKHIESEASNHSNLDNFANRLLYGKITAKSDKNKGEIYTLIQLLYPDLDFDILVQNAELIENLIQELSQIESKEYLQDLIKISNFSCNTHLVLELSKFINKNIGKNSIDEIIALYAAVDCKFLKEASGPDLKQFINITSKLSKFDNFKQIFKIVDKFDDNQIKICKDFRAISSSKLLDIAVNSTNKQILSLLTIFKKLNQETRSSLANLLERHPAHTDLFIEKFTDLSDKRVKPLADILDIISDKGFSGEEFTLVFNKIRSKKPYLLQRLYQTIKLHNLDKDSILKILNDKTISKALNAHEKDLYNQNTERYDYDLTKVIDHINQITYKPTNTNEDVALSKRERRQILSDYIQIMAFMKNSPIMVNEDQNGNRESKSICNLTENDFKKLVKLCKEKINSKDITYEMRHKYELMLIALAVDAIDRTTRDPNKHDESRFPRDVQIIAVLNSINHSGNILNEVITGEGKGYTSAIHALWALGHKGTSYITTSNNKLSRYELNKFSQFYNYLGIKCSKNIISKDSEITDYIEEGVNYSTASEFSLYLKKMALEGHRLKGTPYLICDEADATLTTKVENHLAASVNKIFRDVKKWKIIYEQMMEFVNEEDFQNTLTRKEDVDKFREYLRTKITISDKIKKKKSLLAFIQNPHISDLILDKLLDSAIIANALEEDKDYVIVDKKENDNKAYKYAAPILDSTKKPDSSINYGDGVQQLLHAKLSTAKLIFKLEPNSQTIITSNAKNFFDYFNLRGGRIIGLTGSAGSEKETQEFLSQNRFTSFRIPRFMEVATNDLGTKWELNQNEQFAKILELINNNDPKDRPIFIFAESPKAVTEINKYLQANKLERKIQLYNGVEIDTKEETIVQIASNKNSITITTEGLARGADFNTEHSPLLINACVNLTERDLIQMRGRINRNNKAGSFVNVINIEQLGLDANSTNEERHEAFIANQQRISKEQQEYRLKYAPLHEIRNFIIEKYFLGLKIDSDIIAREQFGRYNSFIDHDEFLQQISDFNKNMDEKYEKLLTEGLTPSQTNKALIEFGVSEYNKSLNILIKDSALESFKATEPLVPLAEIEKLPSNTIIKQKDLLQISKIAKEAYSSLGHQNTEIIYKQLDNFIELFDPYFKGERSLQNQIGCLIKNHPAYDQDEIFQQIDSCAQILVESSRDLSNIPIIGRLINHKSINEAILTYAGAYKFALSIQEESEMKQGVIYFTKVEEKLHYQLVSANGKIIKGEIDYSSIPGLDIAEPNLIQHLNLHKKDILTQTGNVGNIKRIIEQGDWDNLYLLSQEEQQRLSAWIATAKSTLQIFANASQAYSIVSNGLNIAKTVASGGVDWIIGQILQVIINSVIKEVLANLPENQKFIADLMLNTGDIVALIMPLIDNLGNLDKNTTIEKFVAIFEELLTNKTIVTLISKLLDANEHSSLNSYLTSSPDIFKLLKEYTKQGFNIQIGNKEPEKDNLFIYLKEGKLYCKYKSLTNELQEIQLNCDDPELIQSINNNPDFNKIDKLLESHNITRYNVVRKLKLADFIEKPDMLIDVVSKLNEYPLIMKIIEKSGYKKVIKIFKKLAPMAHSFKDWNFKQLVSFVKIMAHPEFSNFLELLPKKSNLNDIKQWLINKDLIIGEKTEVEIPKKVTDAIQELKDFNDSAVVRARETDAKVKEIKVKYKLAEEQVSEFITNLHSKIPNRHQNEDKSLITLEDLPSSTLLSPIIVSTKNISVGLPKFIKPEMLKINTLNIDDHLQKLVLYSSNNIDKNIKKEYINSLLSITTDPNISIKDKKAFTKNIVKVMKILSEVTKVEEININDLKSNIENVILNYNKNWFKSNDRKILAETILTKVKEATNIVDISKILINSQEALINDDQKADNTFSGWLFSWFRNNKGSSRLLDSIEILTHTTNVCLIATTEVHSKDESFKLFCHHLTVLTAKMKSKQLIINNDNSDIANQLSALALVLGTTKQDQEKIGLEIVTLLKTINKNDYHKSVGVLIDNVLSLKDESGLYYIPKTISFVDKLSQTRNQTSSSLS